MTGNGNYPTHFVVEDVKGTICGRYGLKGYEKATLITGWIPMEEVVENLREHGAIPCDDCMGRWALMLLAQTEL